MHGETIVSSRPERGQGPVVPARVLFDMCLHIMYKKTMAAGDYRTALAAAIREYEALGHRRREIDDRLAQLAETIGTLNRLLGYTPTVPLGLTDAVRLVTRQGVPMTPVDVRDRLRAIGFDLSKYANELAAVHTILKRLHRAGELRFLPRAAGGHQYTQHRPVTSIVLSADILQRMRDNAHEREAMHATSDEAPSPQQSRSGAGRRTRGERRAGDANRARRKR